MKVFGINPQATATVCPCLEELSITLSVKHEGGCLMFMGSDIIKKYVCSSNERQKLNEDAAISNRCV